MSPPPGSPLLRLWIYLLPTSQRPSYPLSQVFISSSHSLQCPSFHQHLNTSSISSFPSNFSYQCHPFLSLLFLTHLLYLTSPAPGFTASGIRMNPSSTALALNFSLSSNSVTSDEHCRHVDVPEAPQMQQVLSISYVSAIKCFSLYLRFSACITPPVFRPEMGLYLTFFLLHLLLFSSLCSTFRSQNMDNCNSQALVSLSLVLCFLNTTCTKYPNNLSTMILTTPHNC